MLKNKLSAYLLVGVMTLVGLGSGVAIIASAQSVSTTTTPVITPVNTTVKTEAVDTPEVGDVPDVVGKQSDKAGDKDGDSASEASEGTGSTDTGE
jgi:hypothetical protein